MYAVTVRFEIDPAQAPAFLPLMKDNARASLDKEPGCHRFDVCRDADGAIFLYELYSDRAAFDAHLQSAHFKTFDRAISDMVISKSVQTYDEVWS